MEALKDAKHEARCMELDLADALKHLRSTETLFDHLNEAIRRHAAVGRHLRAALTEVAHRRQVLSMMYPANLGGGHGPDRTASEAARDIGARVAALTAQAEQALPPNPEEA